MPSYPFSEKISHVKKSGIREIFDIAETLPDYINLGIGEPDFNVPSFIARAASKSIIEGKTKYTSNAGILELRQAIVRKLKRENGIDAEPKSEVIVTQGATQAIFVLMNCLLNQGDEVILPTPLFTAYKYTTRLAGGNPVEVPMDERDGFALNVTRLKKAITKRSKLLVLNSPCNPTGAVFDRKNIEAACNLAVESGLYVVSDEIYEKFLYDGAKHFSPASLSEFKDRVITINGFSKTYAMTGWRIGYAVANEAVVRAMTLYNMYNAVCANSLAQYAALRALEHSQSFFDPILKTFKRRREVACNGLRELGFEFVRPLGAFYAFPDLTGIKMDSVSFCKNLLVDQRVSTVPGSSFGEAGEGHIRVSYAVNDKRLKLGLNKMKNFVETI